MPTMPGLVEAIACAGNVEVDNLRRFGDDLEQWLSFLSVDQPWLSAEENYANRSTFLRLTHEVQQHIVAAEASAISTPPPDWLLRFVWQQADAQAAIFTFNYDTLLERALTVIQRVGTWADIYAAPLTTRSAAASGLFLGPSDPRGALPAVYKLHGSINWAFGGLEAPPNDPIVMTDDLLKWSSQPAEAPVMPPRYQHMFDDLTPLLVPPTFSKGPYFANRGLKAQWRSGATSLAAASELIVAGYSFPAGDLVARQWLATSASPQSAVVVDRDESVRDRLSTILGESVPVAYFDSLEGYVAATCGPLVRWRLYIHENDSLGLQIDLTMDGEDLLSSLDRAAPPWNPFDETAHLWLESLLSRVMPGAASQAVNERSPEGRLRTAKFYVAPEGWELDRALMAELLITR